MIPLMAGVYIAHFDNPPFSNSEKQITTNVDRRVQTPAASPLKKIMYYPKIFWVLYPVHSPISLFLDFNLRTLPTADSLK